MFGVIFGNPAPKCPVCGQKMVNVPFHQVPPAALREFARLNKYQPLNEYGWYACHKCGIHIHKQAVENANRPYRR
jgi:ribosomal protein L34E